MGLYGAKETLQNEGPTSHVTSAATKVITSLPQQGLGSLLPEFHLCRGEAGDVGAERPAPQPLLGWLFPPAPLSTTRAGGARKRRLIPWALSGLIAGCRVLSSRDHLLLPLATCGSRALQLLVRAISRNGLTFGAAKL